MFNKNTIDVYIVSHIYPYFISNEVWTMFMHCDRMDTPL